MFRIAGTAFAAHVEDATSVLVEQQPVGLGILRGVPAVRNVDDRELEALAAVHGEDLHGSGVAVETADAVGRPAVGVVDPLFEPPRQCGETE